MRYTIEEIASSKTVENAGRSALVVEYDGSILLLSAPAIVPDVQRVVVQAFNPGRDILYHSFEKLTPDELSEEIAIHVPDSLRARIKERVAASSVAGLVLIQYVPADCHAISPLAALEEILSKAGSVNSAILQADNGGLLFVRKAGADIRSYSSTHSFNEFMNFTFSERETIFPDFHASEIILSGSDIDYSENFDLDDSLETARRISISDFSSINNFADDAAILLQMNPNLYTLSIGAASVFAAIAFQA